MTRVIQGLWGAGGYGMEDETTTADASVAIQLLTDHLEQYMDSFVKNLSFCAVSSTEAEVVDALEKEGLVLIGAAAGPFVEAFAKRVVEKARQHGLDVHIQEPSSWLKSRGVKDLDQYAVLRTAKCELSRTAAEKWLVQMQNLTLRIRLLAKNSGPGRLAS